MPSVLFPGDALVVTPHYVARFCPHNHARPHYADLDLFSITHLTDGFGIISKRVLPAELFRNAGKCGIGIDHRFCLKIPAPAHRSQRFQIFSACRVLRRALSAAAPANIYVTSAKDRGPDTAAAWIILAASATATAISSAAHIPGRVVPDRVKERIDLLGLVYRVLIVCAF